MQKVAYIINPYSAKKNYKSFLAELHKRVKDPLYLVSQSVAESDAFIEKHWDDTDIFLAVGGDGTISTVAQKLINTDKILGIFPAGSGNGFSRETLFDTNIDLLLKKIGKGNFKSIDTFTVNGRFSINMAGVGFDGAVAEAFEKTSRGFWNYIKTSFKVYFSFQPALVKFEDQYKEKDGAYLMLTLANSRQFGNNAYIAPAADLSDGLLEMVLVKKFPFWYALPFAWRMFNKKLRNSRYIEYVSVSEISFFTNCYSWHLDGEFTKIESPVEVKVLPQSLRVLTV